MSILMVSLSSVLNMKKNLSIGLRLGIALFVFSVIMCFITDYQSAAFYACVFSAVIDFVFSVVLCILLKKQNE